MIMRDTITSSQTSEIEALKSLPISRWADQFAEWDSQLADDILVLADAEDKDYSFDCEA
jgi:hypothetical protein